MGDTHSCYSNSAGLGGGRIFPQCGYDSQQQEEGGQGKGGGEKEGMNDTERDIASGMATIALRFLASINIFVRVVSLDGSVTRLLYPGV